MIDITIIGFGNVGSTLTWLLLNNERDLRINVMDPNDQCKGAFLDLEHGMSLFHNKEFHVNDTELFQNSDFIFFTAGTPNANGSSRLEMANQNSDLAKYIFEPIKFIKSPFVFIITNPVDIVSHAVFKYSGLPSENIIGTGTFLDSIRLEYYLSKISNHNSGELKALILGEHGSSQVPIFSMIKVNGKAILDTKDFNLEEINHARKLTLNAAFEIRKTQQATKYAVSKCAEMMFNYVLGNEEHLLALSMLTNKHYRELLKLDNDIFISLPVKVIKGKFEINNDIVFTDKELEAYRVSANIISENIH